MHKNDNDADLHTQSIAMRISVFSDLGAYTFTSCSRRLSTAFSRLFVCPWFFASRLAGRPNTDRSFRAIVSIPLNSDNDSQPEKLKSFELKQPHFKLSVLNQCVKRVVMIPEIFGADITWHDNQLFTYLHTNMFMYLRTSMNWTFWGSAANTAKGG
jgi:hypothetical protein